MRQTNNHVMTTDRQFVNASLAHGRQRSCAAICRGIISTILFGYTGPVAVRLWNGERVSGMPDARCTITIHDAGVLRELVLRRDLLRLADAYLSGSIEVEGDMESLFELKQHLAESELSYGARLYLLGQTLRLPGRTPQDSTRRKWVNRSAHSNTRTSIAHHYDVSNGFYRLWLDPEMVYSCAYFRDSSQSLAEAQRDKLDYLCRKLRLCPGLSLLDIGCGWGALALWAARHYGVRVHGITLSREQYRLARQRVCKAGLEQQIHVELRDYRNLDADAIYDRVISVGMFEHVGVKNYPLYFGTVQRVLRPGGLFLNHGITSENGWQRTPLTCFMNHYIFPDGELARIAEVIGAMEQAGFEIVDVESLRRHYTLTLHHWGRALETNRDEAIRQSDEKTYRLWRLYMAGCAHYFDGGSIGVHQVLAGHRHSPLPLPLRREDLYTNSKPIERVQP